MRVLSKNTVSPIAVAATIESARSTSALADAAVNAPAPAVASTQTTRRALPTVERTALTATDSVGLASATIPAPTLSAARAAIRAAPV